MSQRMKEQLHHTPTPLALWMREASGLWALLAMSCLPGSSQVHFNFLLQGSQWLLHRATAPQLCSTGSLFSISTASLHLLLRCGLRLIHKAGFQWLLNCYIRGWIIVISSPHGRHPSASSQIAVIHCRQPVIASKAAAGTLLTSALKMGF